MAEHVGRDASFAEYVDLRWSMLHRLATLLVGPDGAAGLTRAALVRVYVSWPDVGDSGSPDTAVKRILAGLAGHEAGGRHETGPGDGEDLWAALGRLLPRQRAILVLRHYERLDDTEIAAALGRPRAEVAEERLALETGLDLSRLDEKLRSRSDAAVAPPPPTDALVAEGRTLLRRRRQRSWRWVAVGAATLAAGLAVANLLDAPRSHPRPAAAERTARFLTMLPPGAPPRIAYSAGRTLHFGEGRTLVLDDLPTAIVQTRKWLFVSDLSGGILRIDTNTGAAQKAVESSGGGLVTDPAGDHVAWLAAGAGPAVVVLRTVWDWAVPLSDEQRFPARARCCDDPFVVDGITQAGQVVASRPTAHQTWVWSTPDAGSTTSLTEVSGLGEGVVTQVTPAGVAVRRAPSQYALGVLDEGRFVRTAALAARVADFSDPRGRRAVLVDENGETRVLEIAFGRRGRRGTQDVRLRLPAGVGEFTAARWEDDGHVLLDVSDASLPHGALVRCAVDTGDCELAVRFDGPHLVAS
ncbi:MAG TPA: sigma factor-like helix-turn-helix DNA-binding protein [Marmoricola sp.]